MTDDIVARLRAYVASEAKYGAEAHLDPDVAEASADEIERLRAERDKWRSEAHTWAEAASIATEANLNFTREIARKDAALREIAGFELYGDYSNAYEIQPIARAALGEKKDG